MPWLVTLFGLVGLNRQKKDKKKKRNVNRGTALLLLRESHKRLEAKRIGLASYSSSSPTPDSQPRVRPAPGGKAAPGGEAARRPSPSPGSRPSSRLVLQGRRRRRVFPAARLRFAFPVSPAPSPRARAPVRGRCSRDGECPRRRVSRPFSSASAQATDCC